MKQSAAPGIFFGLAGLGFGACAASGEDASFDWYGDGGRVGGGALEPELDST